MNNWNQLRHDFALLVTLRLIQVRTIYDCSTTGTLCFRPKLLATSLSVKWFFLRCQVTERTCCAPGGKACVSIIVAKPIRVLNCTHLRGTTNAPLILNFASPMCFLCHHHPYPSNLARTHSLCCLAASQFFFHFYIIVFNLEQFLKTWEIMESWIYSRCVIAMWNHILKLQNV